MVLCYCSRFQFKDRIPLWWFKRQWCCKVHIVVIDHFVLQMSKWNVNNIPFLHKIVSMMWWKMGFVPIKSLTIHTWNNCNVIVCCVSFCLQKASPNKPFFVTNALHKNHFEITIKQAPLVFTSKPIESVKWIAWQLLQSCATWLLSFQIDFKDQQNQNFQKVHHILLWWRTWSQRVPNPLTWVSFFLSPLMVLDLALLVHACKGGRCLTSN